MNPTASLAYTHRSIAPWLFRAVAFRTAADMAKSRGADIELIKDNRRAMRIAAYTMRNALNAVRECNRRNAA